MEKQYAKGIYIKKFNNQYGDWLSVAIKKDDGTYDNYKFYQKKEQKNDKYIEYYGVVDDWKPEQDNIVKFKQPEVDEIPF